MKKKQLYNSILTKYYEITICLTLIIQHISFLCERLLSNNFECIPRHSNEMIQSGCTDYNLKCYLLILQAIL